MTTPLTVNSLNWAAKRRNDFSAVLSLIDPSRSPSDPLGFRNGRGGSRPPQMVRRFEDLDWRQPGVWLPEPEDMDAILAFGRAHTAPGLLVHCEAGVSRSTAAALAILADRLGPGREDDALAELLRIKPDAVPNLLLVALADAALGRAGALQAAVACHEAGNRHWAANREAKRKKYAQRPYDYAAPPARAA